MKIKLTDKQRATLRLLANPREVTVACSLGHEYEILKTDLPAKCSTYVEPAYGGDLHGIGNINTDCGLELQVKGEGWTTSSELGRLIYREDENNYKYPRSFAKIGTDRTRELRAAGLLERKFIGYLGQFKHRLTDRGRAALEGRSI